MIEEWSKIDIEIRQKCLIFLLNLVSKKKEKKNEKKNKKSHGGRSEGGFPMTSDQKRKFPFRKFPFFGQNRLHRFWPTCALLWSARENFSKFSRKFRFQNFSKILRKRTYSVSAAVRGPSVAPGPPSQLQGLRCSPEFFRIFLKIPGNSVPDLRLRVPVRSDFL